MTKAESLQAAHIGPSAILERAGLRKEPCPFLHLRFGKILAFVANLALVLSAATAMSCSVLSTRPVQEMSDTAAAIRAAKEVQSDTLAPELYRQSNEWFFKAKREYKFKNFDLAKTYSSKARRFAEEAEFEAIRNGGNRSDAQISDPMAPGLSSPPTLPLPTPSPSPYAYPTPTGVPADGSGSEGPPGGSAPSPTP